ADHSLNDSSTPNNISTSFNFRSAQELQQEEQLYRCRYDLDQSRSHSAGPPPQPHGGCPQRRAAEFFYPAHGEVEHVTSVSAGPEGSTEEDANACSYNGRQQHQTWSSTTSSSSGQLHQDNYHFPQHEEDLLQPAIDVVEGEHEISLLRQEQKILREQQQKLQKQQHLLNLQEQKLRQLQVETQLQQGQQQMQVEQQQQAQNGAAHPHGSPNNSIMLANGTSNAISKN
ncbi:unnamed protein product, partial [Amoebophrya sp. A25]